MKTPEQAAEEYWQEILKVNPNGFAVADYVNADTVPDAFLAGFAEGAAREKARAEKLVEALEYYANQCPEQCPPDGEWTPILPPEMAEKAKQALQAYRDSEGGT